MCYINQQGTQYCTSIQSGAIQKRMVIIEAAETEISLLSVPSLSCYETLNPMFPII